MKTLITVLALIVGTTLSAQTKTTVFELEDNKYLVEITEDGALVQEGFQILRDGKLINHGKWTQFNEDGIALMEVTYHYGRLVEAIRYEDDMAYSFKRNI